MIKAEIIADSKNEFGNRITTFVLTFPRIVLAEFNTHRMISKNSASSRAIPFKKMLEMVQTNPFIPIKWMKDHKGMQGNEYYHYPSDILECQKLWKQARDKAIESAESLAYLYKGVTGVPDNGVTKQICNRLLEPFMWHTVICTGTEWENFFALRAHEAAEIHIQDLAYKMLDTYNNSTPKQLKAGQWHIPFGDKIDSARLIPLEPENQDEDVFDQLAIKIATARCARVSYLNFEGKDDYEADIKLHDNLLASGHASPTEHCAICTNDSKYYGNFKGFKQYRKILEENGTLVSYN